MLRGLLGSPSHRLQRAFAKAAASVPAGPLRDYYAAGLPDLDGPADAVPMVAIDLETDGLDLKQPAILEAGLVAMDLRELHLGTARRIRFRVESDLNPDAVLIHRITDDEANAAQPAREALAQLLGELTGKVLVAHFSRIESEFIDAICRSHFDTPFVAPFICTKQLEERWFPRQRAMDGLRLPKLRARYGLPSYAEHDGLADAIACGELLLAQVAHHGAEDLQLRDLLRR